MRYNILSDTELLALLKADDEKAFEEIYQRYWQTLYQSAWKRLKDHELSKDIVQDIFVYFWSKRITLTIINIEAWLKTAIKYQVYKRIAKNKSQVSIDLNWQQPSTSDDLADNLVRTNELNSAMHHVVKNLPAKRQTIFQLRYSENLSTIDIAQKLDLSRKTVQNQLNRAIKSIYDSLTVKQK